MACGFNSSCGSNFPNPAQFIRMLISSFFSFPHAKSVEVSSDKSALKKLKLACGIVSLSIVLLIPITLYPKLKSLKAISLPIPLLAPVTTAVCIVSPK